MYNGSALGVVLGAVVCTAVGVEGFLRWSVNRAATEYFEMGECRRLALSTAGRRYVIAHRFRASICRDANRCFCSRCKSLFLCKKRYHCLAYCDARSIFYSALCLCVDRASAKMFRRSLLEGGKKSSDKPFANN